MLNLTLERANSLTSRSKIVRDTYRLLSLTLLFSAGTAYVGMLYPVGFVAYLVMLVAAIGLMFAVSAFRNSGFGVVLLFAFTGLMGYTLGPTLNHYLATAHGTQAVSLALLTTGATFIGLSAYVHITKRDFAGLGGYLFVALVALLVVSIFGLFFPTPFLSLALGYAGAVIFGGYILYHTSELVHGRETNYVLATMSLYLDILNLFLSLLRIFGSNK